MYRLVFVLCALVQSPALAQGDSLDSIARSLENMRTDNLANEFNKNNQVIRDSFNQQNAQYYYNVAINLQQQLALAGRQVAAAQALAKDADRNKNRMATTVNKLEAEVAQLKKELKQEKEVFNKLVLDIANRLQQGDTNKISSFLVDVHKMVNKKEDLEISVSLSKKKASQ